MNKIHRTLILVGACVAAFFIYYTSNNFDSVPNKTLIHLTDIELENISVGAGANCKKCAPAGYACELPSGISREDECSHFIQSLCTSNRMVGMKYQSTCNKDNRVSTCGAGGPGDNCVPKTDGSGCGAFMSCTGCIWSGGTCAAQGTPVACNGDNC